MINKKDVVIFECGCYNPLTNAHLRLFGENFYFKKITNLIYFNEKSFIHKS